MHSACVVFCGCTKSNANVMLSRTSQHNITDNMNMIKRIDKTAVKHNKTSIKTAPQKARNKHTIHALRNGNRKIANDTKNCMHRKQLTIL
jgi:hypothetical protein